MTLAEATQEIETQGVVAVIRLQDTGRLRAVVDALAAGGVRALEVTMTVPRRGRGDSRARADAARRVPARRGHGARRRDGASA